jgi:hypothetical protein
MSLRRSARTRHDRIASLLNDTGAPLDDLPRVDLIGIVTGSRSVDVLKCLVTRHQVNFSTLRDSSGRFSLHHCLIAEAHRALHCAAEKFNARAMRVLVELGADVDQQAADGSTALHMLFGPRGG